MTRELVVLGTSSQVPTRHRNHNGYLLRWDGEGILFDPGEGTQRQMTRAGVSASAITRICVTHFHGDHCLGLPGIVQRLSLDGAPQTVDIHYPASGQVYFDRLRHASIFVDRASTRARPLTHPGEIHRDERLVLTASPLEHTAESWGYRVEDPPRRRLLADRLAALGLHGPPVGRLAREGSIAHRGRTVTLEEVSEDRPAQSFAFVMDTRRCRAAVELARGVDLLVIESTYLESHAEEARDRGHLTAAEAAGIAAEAGARQVVLTHFSQRHPDSRVFAEEASRHCDIPIHTAADGEILPLPRRG